MCSIQKITPQIAALSDRGIQGTSKDNDVKWCVKVRDWAIPMQHQLSAQCWADGINMWLTDVLTFNHTLGIQIARLGYLWIIRNVDKTVFLNS